MSKKKKYNTHRLHLANMIKMNDNKQNKKLGDLKYRTNFQQKNKKIKRQEEEQKTEGLFSHTHTHKSEWKQKKIM